MVVVGFAVGFRVHTELPARSSAPMLIVLLFGFALVLDLRDGRAAREGSRDRPGRVVPGARAAVFASSAFVPVDSMPDWLQPFADAPAALLRRHRGARHHIGDARRFDIFLALAWCFGILAVAAPLAVRRYRMAA